ncbi:histone-fold-containing protein, partial [Rhodocollybia butyracea]
KSISERIGLVFPVGRLRRYLRIVAPDKRLTAATPVFLAAVLEYLMAEVLELAGYAARDHQKRNISPRHIHLAVRNDDELVSFI